MNFVQEKNYNNTTLIKLLHKLNKVNNSFNQKKARIVSSNKIFTTDFNFFRFICEDEDLRKSPLRDIVINYFYKCEKHFPGSSYLLSKQLVSVLLFNKDLFEDLSLVEKTYHNLEKYFNSITNTVNSSLVLEILNFSGPDATINFDNSDNALIEMHKKNTAYFPISLSNNFRSIYFKKNNSSTKEFLISIIDGFIERESEIMPLFEYAKNQNQPLVLICRGISEYASNSIKSIILQNKVYIYPYIAKFDNNDPFFLKDISRVLNTDIVSAETGDNIYKDAAGKISSCKIKIFKNKIEIFNKCESLISEINENINSCNVPDLKDYLILRKNRIVSNRVNVMIPNSKIEVLQDIKKLVIQYNYIASLGLVKSKENVIYPKKYVDYIQNILTNMINSITKIGYVIKTS